jgi:threonyl-tRNA synthetase
MAKRERSIKTDKQSDISKIRHSASHVLAEAVLGLYPDTKLAIGPATEDGFYYDLDFITPVVEEDLAKIEAEAKKIIKEGRSFERSDMPIDEAIKQAKAEQAPYKLELLEDLKKKGEETVSFYSSMHDGKVTFSDLCAGPHVENSQEIGAFKLLSLAGAYWRGDEKNKQLTRIYGTAFATQTELDEYLVMLGEAKKRDHRKLGQELDLFSLHEEAGSGLVYWHPKGGRIRKAIEDYWREEHIKNGYELLFTPHMGKSWLWQTSGHLGFYNENMYAPMEIDKDEYYIKPMNCPFHIMIYQTQTRSYRDLPMRWAELGTVYRYERSGVLYGLLRVRGFTQDDAHIICTPEQIDDEIAEVLRFSLEMWKAFGFKDIKAYLATKPEKSVGEQTDWDIALESLRKAVEKEGLDYEMDEGGGAFYGPKIDLKIKDALGREWQMTTIQFDFNLPERFNMNFVDATGKERRPFMVHRALLGSIERFFGVLIEHYAGAFPLWLAPIQAKVLPISDKHLDYAEKVYQELREAGIRVELDSSNESIGKKIREAEMKKVPYMLIVGDKEKEAGTVAVRSRAKDDLGAMDLKKFIKMTSDEINAKR